MLICGIFRYFNLFVTIVSSAISYVLEIRQIICPENPVNSERIL